ncbi:MAG: hypothetical protein ACT4O5_02045 [Gammaproteobacteria bacterium]
MARSARAQRKAPTRRLKRRPAPPKPAASTPWPSIEAFLESEEGNISLGSIGYNSSLGYTAVASDDHNMLVALVRRSGETLHQLLVRLERALGPAIDEQIFVDEINAPTVTK